MSEPKPLPSATDPRWRDIVTGKTTRPWKMLALKILMTRIVQTMQDNPSPETIAANIEELHAFFVKNRQAARDDLASLFD